MPDPASTTTTSCTARRRSSRCGSISSSAIQFSWRAPGIDLVPIGYINQHHEPTQFYSVLRPELYNGLIPSTWKVPATSIYGTIVDGIKYQLMPPPRTRILATRSIFEPKPGQFRRFPFLIFRAWMASTHWLSPTHRLAIFPTHQ